MATTTKFQASKNLLNDRSFPPEMRRQMWPLCCGASILSGLKHAGNLTEEELVAEIDFVINKTTPDFQIFNGEQMKPHLTFLTLNSQQMGSKKIMDCVAKAGFTKFAEGTPRGSPQGFFIRDTSNSFKVIAA